MFGPATSWNSSVLQEIGTIAGNKIWTSDGDGSEMLLLSTKRQVHVAVHFSRLAKDIFFQRGVTCRDGHPAVSLALRKSCILCKVL